MPNTSITAEGAVSIWAPFSTQSRRLTLRDSGGCLPPVFPAQATVYFYPEPLPSGGIHPWILIHLWYDLSTRLDQPLLVRKEKLDDPALLFELVTVKPTKSPPISKPNPRVGLSEKTMNKLVEAVGDPSNEGFYVFSRMVPGTRPAVVLRLDDFNYAWWTKL